jgi:hypothetical protein
LRVQMLREKKQDGDNQGANEHRRKVAGRQRRTNERTGEELE